MGSLLIDTNYQNKEKIKSLLAYYLLLTSSQTIPFFNNYYFLLISTIVLGAYIHKVLKVNTNIYQVVILLIVVYLLGLFIFLSIVPHISEIIRHVSYILIGIYISAILNTNWVFFIEKAIYKLTIISLVLFSLQIAFPSYVFSSISAINSTLHLGRSYLEGNFGNNVSNMFIYAVNQSNMNISSFRNCGFAFEPGFFSLFLNLGILFNLLLHDFKLNKHIFIYCLAIITTVSTTGFLGFILIIFFYLVNKKVKFKFYLYVLFLPCLYFIVMSPLVFDKTYELWNERQTPEFYLNSAYLNKSAGDLSMGRFTGNFYMFERSLESPFFGHFGSTQIPIPENLTIPSSLGPFIYTFGVLGLILLLISLYQSSELLIRNDFKLKSHLILFILFLFYFFAFPFVYTTIFWFIPLNHLRKYFSYYH